MTQLMTKLMGIVNVTPDSFSRVGKCGSVVNNAVDYALSLERDGAAVLDIGGESTRPDFTPITCDEEVSRVVPVVKRLALLVSVPISVDTAHADIVAAALDAGATIINDTSGGEHDAITLRHLQTHPHATLILMHRPRHRTEEYQPTNDIVVDVIASLTQRCDFFLQGGIARERLVADVGLGFSKLPRDNWRLVREIGTFRQLGVSLLVGHSRKRFLGGESPEQRLAVTLAVSRWLIAQRVDFLRVHDVAAHQRLLGWLPGLLLGNGTDSRADSFAMSRK